jgi:hypothetical protein
VKPIQLPTKELIERIAEIIPKDITADYYREMLYCCSLPENDEILRILRVMQVLTLLMDRIPSRVMDEREALERLFRETASGLKAVLSSSESFQKQLDMRLSLLPAAIADGIDPEDIAKTINESLHQQFVASTIPQTGKALAVIAEQMRTVSSEFSSTASDIGSSYRGAAEQARQAIDNIRTSVTHASNAAKQATAELSIKFKDAYWVMVSVLALAVLLTGVWLGVFFVRKFDPPKYEVIERVIERVPEPALPIKPKRK